MSTDRTLKLAAHGLGLTPRFSGSYDRVAEGSVLRFTEGAYVAHGFVGHVVPRLQVPSVFRREHEGAAFRENLGLPIPARPEEIHRCHPSLS